MQRERFGGEPLAPGKFIISKATVISLIWMVICCPENKQCRLRGTWEPYQGLSLDFDKLIGDKSYLIGEIKRFFQSQWKVTSKRCRAGYQGVASRYNIDTGIRTTVYGHIDTKESEAIALTLSMIRRMDDNGSFSKM